MLPGIKSAALGSTGTTFNPLPESHTVTTGGSGVAGSRLRGYYTGLYGSISPTSTQIYSGLTIDAVYWDEANAQYVLSIGGASNGGWTTLTINSTALTRASATFGAGIWTWGTSDNISFQAFGTIGSTPSVVFS